MFLGEEHTLTYRLEGKSLEVARKIHEHSQACNKEYAEVLKQINEKSLELQSFTDNLMTEFETKHSPKFTELLEELAKTLHLTREELKYFHLDASYIQDHNIAFMKQVQAPNPNILQAPENPNNGI